MDMPGIGCFTPLSRIGLPGTDTTHVDVDETGGRIISDTAPPKLQGGQAKRREASPGKPTSAAQPRRWRLFLTTRDRGWQASRLSRGAVAGNNLIRLGGFESSANQAEQVKKARLDGFDFIGPVVTQNMVDLPSASESYSPRVQ